MIVMLVFLVTHRLAANTPNSTCVSVRAAGIVERFRKLQTYGMPAARTGCRKKIKAGRIEKGIVEACEDVVCS
jgi:hypothetical protein